MPYSGLDRLLNFQTARFSQKLTRSRGLGRSMKTVSTATSFEPVQDPQSKMYRFQHKLPMLPVPTLEDTCELYLKSVRPFLRTDADRQRTEQAVQSFLVDSFSKELQNRLIARPRMTLPCLVRQTREQLADRVVERLGLYGFQDDPSRRSQTARASNLVSRALEFRDLVVNQLLEPDMAGRGEEAHGLCMHQYKYMFNSVRVPKRPSDITFNYDPNQFRHIVVVRKGIFFTLNLVDSSTGNYLSTGQIEHHLEAIKSAADQTGWDSHPIGILTTENRDKWTEARDILLSHSAINRTSIQQIESSMFVLCLDDTTPTTREEVGRALWHGDGANRYFDKSLQLIVFENGKAGFNGEHSMMDATPTYRFCDYLCSRGLNEPTKSAAQKPSSTFAPQRLAFQLPENFQGYIHNAFTRLKADVDRHDHRVLAYEGYGKDLVKEFGLSPDAFVQMSIQLAYYKLFGELRATYESAQTKKFAWGRTEVCRSVSQESVTFCKAMAQPDLQASQKADLCRAAIKAHGKYMSRAVDGRGVDRHLLGLKLLLKPDEKVPDIFTDPAFKESSTWHISTSQITSEYFDGYGWGEVIPDGFGIAYMIKNNSIHYNIASLKGGPGYEAGPGSWNGKGKGLHHPCSKMAHMLQESLLELRKVFELTTSPAKAKAKL